MHACCPVALEVSGKVSDVSISRLACTHTLQYKDLASTQEQQQTQSKAAQSKETT